MLKLPIMNPLSNIGQFISSTINPFTIGPIIVAAISASMSVFIITLDKKDAFNRAFFYICSAITVWLLSYAFLSSSRANQSSFLWVFMLYMSVSILPVVFYHFVLHFTERFRDKRKELDYVYSFALVIGATSSIQKYSLINNLEYLSPLHVYLFFGIELGFIVVIFFLSLYVLIDSVRTARGSKHRSDVVWQIILMFCLWLGYGDIAADGGMLKYPVGYIGFLAFIMGTVCLRVRRYHHMLLNRTVISEYKALSNEQELTKTLDELRKTQYELVEKERLSTMAVLSTGIVHQISQPLTTVHGLIQFMKENVLRDDKFYQPVVMMEEQTQYMKQIIEDLSALMKHQKVTKVQTHINNIVINQ
jgi:signal transduction histidine kinase